MRYFFVANLKKNHIFKTPVNYLQISRPQILLNPLPEKIENLILVH